MPREIKLEKKGKVDVNEKYRNNKNSEAAVAMASCDGLLKLDEVLKLNEPSGLGTRRKKGSRWGPLAAFS